MPCHLSVEEIAKKLSCSFIGKNKIIKGVSSLKNASEDDISFFSNHKHTKSVLKTNAGACLIKKTDADMLPEKVTKIICSDPYLAYAYVLEMLYPTIPTTHESIASSASISRSARLGKNCIIHHNVVIEDNVVIGDDCTIGSSVYIGRNVKIRNNVSIAPNVTLIECEIGNNCIIHSGVRIGQDGFGFTLDESKKVKKIKQIGKVIIGDNVEIGANSCIDRGALDNTIVGDNTKIDNLVQIGHNVIIGKNCFICGQVGIAGSTTVGDYVMIGGQAGLNGHIEIGHRAQIAAKSGIASNVKDGEKIAGYPGIKIIDWHKQTILLQKMTKK